jgi:hypothetical protein
VLALMLGFLLWACSSVFLVAVYDVPRVKVRYVDKCKTVVSIDRFNEKITETGRS